MANPPFNQKDWRGENELLYDPRWRGYDVPPKSNANYGWILNMVSKLSENGFAGNVEILHLMNFLKEQNLLLKELKIKRQSFPILNSMKKMIFYFKN